MADNVIIPTQGTGTTTPVIATDDVVGVHYQKVKLDLGGDGLTVPAVAGQGVAGTGTLRVTVATDDLVPISAASLPLPAGASTAALQLPDGHNVTVDNASIAVTAAALPLPTGAATSALQLADGHNVTVDNGAAGAAVNVQDGGNSLTIDGTITSDAGTGFPGVATDAGAHGASQTGLRAMGSDGTNDQQIAVDATGNVQVDIVADGAGLATAANQLPDGHAVTVDNASIAVTAAALPLPTGASTAALQLADGHNVTIDNAAGASAVNVQDGGNSITIDGTVTANAGTGTLATSNAIVDGWDNGASDGASVSGDVAHDTADTGEPVKVGNKAVALGVDPTEVAASDRTDWYSSVAGIPFVLGGHMNTKTREWRADAAFTDDDICEAVDASHKMVVTSIAIMVDAAATTNPDVRVGFGAASVPAEPASGASVAGIVTSHSGIAAGSGVVIGSGSGIVGIGALGEELRATVTTPTAGSIRIVTKYFLIAV